MFPVPVPVLYLEMFCNRAALKMAEMDAMCDRLFTRPPVWKQEQERRAGGSRGKEDKGEEVAEEDEEGGREEGGGLLYFADICAGPGGFSEYMLTKLKWRAKGEGERGRRGRTGRTGRRG